MKKVTAVFKNELYHLFDEEGSPVENEGFISYEDVCNYCSDKGLELLKVLGFDEDLAWCSFCKMDVEFDDHGNCELCGKSILS